MGAKNITFCFKVLIGLSSGDFELHISIHSFINPGGLCADALCSSTGQVCTSSCEYSIHACIRQSGARVSISRELGQGKCTTVGKNVTSIVSDDGVFPPATPVIFLGTGSSWVSQTTLAISTYIGVLILANWLVCQV